MKEYEVIVDVTETYRVVVEAESEEEAERDVEDCYGEYLTYAEKVDSYISVNEVNICVEYCPRCGEVMRKVENIKINYPEINVTREAVSAFVCDKCGEHSNIVF